MKNALKFVILSGLLILFSAVMDFGDSGNAIQAVKQYRSAQEHEIIREFVQLLSIPNVSSDRANVRQNAEFIQKMMDGRGISTLEKLSDRKPVFLPSLGGSLPIHMFYTSLKVPIIGISIANRDNNQHQQDENIRIGHLWQGIETYAALLLMDEE